MESSGPVMVLAGGLAVLLIVLGVIGLFIWILLNSRRKDKAREELLAEMGFTRLDQTGDFLQRMEKIYRRSSGQRFKLIALFEKQTVPGNFYVFDLVETSGDENTWMASGSVAFISPDLRLPRFHVSGRLSFKGRMGTWMAGAAEKFIGWASSRIGMNRLDLCEFAEIDERLMVLAESETAATDFLTRERLGRLLWLGNQERLSDLDCSGDCFVIKRTAALARKNMETDLRSLLDDAKRVLTALS